MAPECVEVYLRWILEFYLENLNPLRPLQDLPSFLEKIGIKVIEKLIIKTRLEKFCQMTKVYVTISQKKQDRRYSDSKARNG